MLSSLGKARENQFLGVLCFLLAIEYDIPFVRP